MNKKKFERKLWKRIDKISELVRRKYPTADYWDISGFIESNHRNVYITVKEDTREGKSKNVHSQEIYREVEHREVEYDG